MKRAKYNLGYEKLLSCNMGELVPIGWKEVLPGDVWKHKASALVRTSELVAPIMHSVRVSIFHVFVAYRRIWTDWENFITGGPDGNNASTYPTIVTPASTGFAIGSLADHLGVPTGVPDEPVSALPFRAYADIYNHLFRDEDLITALTIDLTDGVDTTTNTTLQFDAWEKDRFTTARLTPQKGTAVTIPLGTTAPIQADGALQVTSTSFPSGTQVNMSPTVGLSYAGAAVGSPEAASYYAGLEADLSAATGIDVITLREYLAIQRFMEKRSNFGSRYVEYLLSLGVRSSDARLQRPELLGRSKEYIQFSEVVQTAPADVASEVTALGRLGGHGISLLKGNAYLRHFEEHGLVMSLMCVRPKTVYATGLERAWNRRTKYDFWQPEMEHVGQEAIPNKEIYLADSDPEATFGYQDRYDDYRRSESYVSGEFRDSLDYYHMARMLNSDPTLNAAFVNSNPTNRIYADTSADQLRVKVIHDLRAKRLVRSAASRIA